MSILVFTLPLSDGTDRRDFAYTLSSDGHAIKRHGRIGAADLPASGLAATEVVALVPARALSWQRVQLPPGVAVQSPRMRAVLEGLLEDLLLDEPGTLHFALEPGAAAGDPAWVAVCDRAWLRASLHALEAAGRPAGRIVPEAAPPAEPSLHIGGTPEAPWMVVAGLPPNGGVAVLPFSNETPAMLPPQDGAPVAVSCEPAVAQLAEQHLGSAVALQTPSERALHAARQPWDLAQFDLSSSGRTRAMRKAQGLLGALLQAPQWRAARWAAVCLVLAQLVGLNALAWKERTALTAKQAAVARTLTETFPQVQVVVDAPLQMEREVALMRQASGALTSGDLEPLLAAAGAVLAAQGGAQRVDYAADTLRLGGLAPSPTDLATATQVLQGSGYALAQEAGSLVVRPESPR